MRAVLRPEAELELSQAQAWYEARSPGLGLEFARAFDAAVAAALRNPGAYPLIIRTYRRTLLQRFPYSIIYHQERNELVIVACYHQSRRPNAWLGRADD